MVHASRLKNTILGILVNQMQKILHFVSFEELVSDNVDSDPLKNAQ